MRQTGLCPPVGVIIIFFNAGDQTQGLIHGKQVLYHRVSAPAPGLEFFTALPGVVTAASIANHC
jgi:hypothetical protein